MEEEDDYDDFGDGLEDAWDDDAKSTRLRQAILAMADSL